jgi:hypothetical protein
MRRLLNVLFVFLVSSLNAWGSGHGPVFGLATPTNAHGAWSLDSGWMARQGEETGVMLRNMLAYGITEDFQFSFSAPYVIDTAPLSPGRLTGMMPGTFDFEAIVAWRFHRRGTEIGTRMESTVYGGFILPTSQNIEGMLGELEKAPGVIAAIATGMASRSHYVWGGLSYTHFGQKEGDQRPDIFFYSFVWGYRPKFFRKEYPHWDWRFMAEMTGEKSAEVVRDTVSLPETGGHQVFLGPSALGIYKNFAMEAGIQWPVYRNIGARHQKEKFRYALNFSYFF